MKKRYCDNCGREMPEAEAGQATLRVETTWWFTTQDLCRPCTEAVKTALEQVDKEAEPKPVPKWKKLLKEHGPAATAGAVVAFLLRRR
jgi:hypothetical protein